MTVIADTIEHSIQNTKMRLMQMRHPAGFWQGHVTSSAFTTATAVFALATVNRRIYLNLIEGGLQWLKDHQNNDGGWGDTPMSQSRLETTLLCYSAFTVSDGSFIYNETVARTEAWIERAVGSLDAAAIAQAVLTTQSHDKSFSSAVLMMCALAKRLGSMKTAWQHVKPFPLNPFILPLTSLKRSPYSVNGYDISVRIAVALTQRHFNTSFNNGKRHLFFGSVTNSIATLKVLQSDNGGFSASLSLTSFILMSLSATGQVDHPMVTKGASYLVDSVRDNGSWPGEMPLSVRNTTSSFSALAAGDDMRLSDSDNSEFNLTRDWLLTLQRTQHRAGTQAVPGGWAMNDLSDTLPNTYDTADTVITLFHLDPKGRRTQSAAINAIHWLLDLQNKNGGFSLCGTGQPQQTQSCPDITGHVIGAIGCWFYRLPVRLQRQAHKSLQRAVTYLKDRQHVQGYWIPLWYGNENSPVQANPVYGTCGILTYLALLPPAYIQRMSDELTQGAEWLTSVQYENGGWGGDIGIPPSIEETALAVNALATALSDHDLPLFDAQTKGWEHAVRQGAAWLMQQTENGKVFYSRPIGLSFTGHWYCEELYPVIFSLAALQKAWQALQ